ARRLLARTRPQPGQEDLRGWEWRYLWSLTRGDDAGEVARFAGSVFHLAFGDGGRSVAVGLMGGGAQQQGGLLYDLGPTRLLNQRAYADSPVVASAFLSAQKR